MLASTTYQKYCVTSNAHATKPTADCLLSLHYGEPQELKLPLTVYCHVLLLS